MLQDKLDDFVACYNVINLVINLRKLKGLENTEENFKATKLTTFSLYFPGNLAFLKEEPL